ncbi:hypothetical protein HGRIS_002914 [Hohenbuehelia grisea]|uniref:Uncharacterized protein n=1 Tax=Hohenbuehelia grisea TaxID=104357 RepID=A0ABR3JLW3_9AGAR
MDSTLANLLDYDSDDDSDYQPSICSDDEPDECAEEVSDDEEEDPLNGESYRERTAHLRERLDTDILVHVAHKTLDLWAGYDINLPIFLHAISWGDKAC